MARPRSKELTQRELEVMHVFWAGRQPMKGDSKLSEFTAAEVREELASAGRDLAYTTVATLIRILTEKGFLAQTTAQRPFGYQALRSFDDVSDSLLCDLIEKVFGGSREKLLIRLVDKRKLTKRERELLESIPRKHPFHENPNVDEK